MTSQFTYSGEQQVQTESRPTDKVYQQLMEDYQAVMAMLDAREQEQR